MWVQVPPRAPRFLQLNQHLADGDPFRVLPMYLRIDTEAQGSAHDLPPPCGSLHKHAGDRFYKRCCCPVWIQGVLEGHSSHRSVKNYLLGTRGRDKA